MKVWIVTETIYDTDTSEKIIGVFASKERAEENCPSPDWFEVQEHEVVDEASE